MVAVVVKDMLLAEAVEVGRHTATALALGLAHSAVGDKADLSLAACWGAQVVSFGEVTVDAVREEAVAQEVQQIHFVVHHIEAADQGEHIDQVQVVAVDRRSLLEEALFLRDPNNLGIGLPVGLDSLADFCFQAKSLGDLIGCNRFEDQNHCFQRLLQQSILLIPRYLCFEHLLFVRLLLRLLRLDLWLSQPLLGFCYSDLGFPSMYCLEHPSLRMYHFR